MALKMESLRLRLEFKNSDILTAEQKSLGLDKSWVLVPKPNTNFTTVAALSAHILRKFQLNQTCPHGLLLSMDGFALPPFVSIGILKDNDVISVQKIGHLTVEGSDATYKEEEQQLVAINGVNTGTLLLSNVEFDKENGGYEIEESDDEAAEDGNDISKKRKASKKLKSSKKKKQRLEPSETVATGIHRESEYLETPHENEVLSGKKRKSKKGKSSKTENQTTDGENARSDGKTKKDVESASNFKKNEQFKENLEDVDGTTNVSGSTQKGPSRSSRRQYAKRIMLKEMKKVWGKNEDSPSKEGKNRKKRDKKVEKRAGTDQLQNEGTDQPKGLLHLKQFGGKDVSKIWSKPEENQNLMSNRNSYKDNDTSNGAVPIEIRPGHIRFEALEEDQEVQQSQVSLETFQWNGITSKKKGQKWGTTKGSTSRRNDCEPKEANLENIHASELVDYDKFPPLPGMPEKGDVIAYRLLELSSSWAPEISSYRVGKVSSYNSQSQKIELLPVPEYPIVSKNLDEDDLTAQLDDSIYSKDGSLEVDFTSLVDVRTIKNNNIDRLASKRIAEHADEGHICNENGITSMPLDSNEKFTDSMVKSNGSTNQDNSAQAPSTPEKGVDLWEQLSEALNSKKEELSKESSWGKITPSNRNTSSYGAFESSAVRPSTSYRGRGRNYPTSYRGRGRGRNSPTMSYRGRGRNYGGN